MKKSVSREQAAGRKAAALRANLKRRKAAGRKLSKPDSVAKANTDSEKAKD